MVRRSLVGEPTREPPSEGPRPRDRHPGLGRGERGTRRARCFARPIDIQSERVPPPTRGRALESALEHVLRDVARGVLDRADPGRADPCRAVLGRAVLERAVVERAALELGGWSSPPARVGRARGRRRHRLAGSRPIDGRLRSCGMSLGASGRPESVRVTVRRLARSIPGRPACYMAGQTVRSDRWRAGTTTFW